MNGERLVYQKYIYIMMNKPKNVVSATEDAVVEETVAEEAPTEETVTE